MPSPISRVWQELRWIMRVSRPRFWLYLFGPYLLGIVAAFKYSAERYSFVPTSDHWFADGTFLINLAKSMGQLVLHEPGTAALVLLWLGIAFGYFLFSANLLVYGINDIFDSETDAINAKKDGYEVRVQPSQRVRLLIWIVLAQLPWMFVGIVILTGSSWWEIHRTLLAFLAFLFLSIFYSAPPIRAKARPFLDSLFNILYVMPGLSSFFFLVDRGAVGLLRTPFPWLPVLAASLWCMAMHAYSAVPDIAADKQAHLSTIATKLGARRTLLTCLALYATAALTAFSATPSPLLRTLFLALGLLYVSMMTLSLIEKKDLLRIYKRFPLINTLAGMALFFGMLWG